MIHHGTGRRLRLTAGAAALLILLTACGTAGGDAEQTSAPASAAPSSTTAPPAPDATEAPPASDAAASDGLSLDASTPVSLSIPAIGLDSDLIVTGLRDDGALEVPPGEDGSPASWYDGSPTPGERGASVVLGHVDSLTDESGVFFDLHRLQPGDEVSIAREDGSIAVFVVDRSESFAKDEFPTRAVYFPVPGAELRLITCQEGDDPDRVFPNNLVVFATLVDTA